MKDTYFTDIEQAFCTRRGKQSFVGPCDWQLMEQWKERGVPLHIVLNAIDNVFNKRKDDTRKVNSLSYCKTEVEALFKEWQTSQVGKHDSQEIVAQKEDDYATETLNKLQTKYDQLGWLAIAEGTPDKLKEAITNITPDLIVMFSLFTVRKDAEQAEQLEETLTACEQKLNDALLESVPTTQGMKLMLEIEAELSPYKTQMSKEDFAKQINEMFLKRLRERFGVPRLSLFYL